MRVVLNKAGNGVDKYEDFVTGWLTKNGGVIGGWKPAWSLHKRIYYQVKYMVATVWICAAALLALRVKPDNFLLG
jgi:hypothetical protein